jgi:hypothetical protein
VRGAGKASHLHADIGDDHPGGAGVDTVDGVQQLDLGPVGGQLGVDVGVQLAHHGADRVDVDQDHPGEEGVVFAEASGQRLGQGADLDPPSAPGRLGQHARVAFAAMSASSIARPEGLAP